MAPHNRFSTWLEVEEPSRPGPGLGHGGFLLHVYNKFDQVVQELDPCHAKPSVVMMWGGRQKDEALSTLLARRDVPARATHSRSSYGMILHSNTNRPIIFVDCHEVRPGPNHSPRNKLPPRSWGVGRQHCVAVPAGSTSTLRQLAAFDRVGAQVLMVLADVVCVFIRDFDDVTEVERRMAAWIALGPASTLPGAVRPRLLLVTDEYTRAWAVKTLERRLTDLQSQKGHQIFSTVTVVGVGEQPSLGRVARHLCLKQTIWTLSDEVQIERWKTQTLFAGRHLVGFFHRLVEHLATGHYEPFDFIQAAHLHRRVSQHLPDILEEFFRDFHCMASVVRLVVPVVISSFLRHYCVSGRHLFDTDVAFETLYRPGCERALKQTASGRATNCPSTATLLKMIRKGFLALHDQWRDHHLDIAALHHENLFRLKGHWQSRYRSGSCFACLAQRNPEHTLACGHRLCRACVQSMGHASTGDPYGYPVASCPLCWKATGQFQIGLRPTHAGLRVVSLDGGGCGGIIGLTFLDVLERHLKVPGIANCLGDLIVGTSIGGVSMAGVFHKGWPISRCLSTFQPVASKVFTRRRFAMPRTRQDLRTVFTSCLRESIYAPEVVDETLQDLYGDEFVDDASSFAARYGIKSAMTVTTVPDTQRRLITNYNGFGTRRTDCDYRPVENPDDHRGFTLAESAGCTSAAPIYFPPHELSHTQRKYKDGGTFLNNPVAVAVAESRAITSARRDSRSYTDYLPDIILSLGSGSVSRGDDDTLAPAVITAQQGWDDIRQAYRESGIGQMCGYLNTTMDGDIGGRAFQTTHPAVINQGRYYRFDVAWPPSMPKLDNVAAIPYMRLVAERWFRDAPALQDFGRAVFSLQIYLDDIDPVFDPNKGHFVVHARVRCSLRAADEIYQAFHAQAIQPPGTAILSHGIVQAPTTFDHNGDLDQRVSIELPSLETPLQVFWRVGSGPAKHISGSPFDVQQIYGMSYYPRAFEGL